MLLNKYYRNKEMFESFFKWFSLSLSLRFKLNLMFIVYGLKDGVDGVR